MSTKHYYRQLALNACLEEQWHYGSAIRAMMESSALNYKQSEKYINEQFDGCALYTDNNPPPDYEDDES